MVNTARHLRWTEHRGQGGSMEPFLVDAELGEAGRWEFFERSLMDLAPTWYPLKPTDDRIKKAQQVSTLLSA